MKIINGQKIAEEIKKELKQRLIKLGRMPGLAVILVGRDKASQLYLKLKEQTAKELGILFCKYIFSAQTPANEILKTINWLNIDDQIDGIIVQLPLPQAWPIDKVIKAINPKKDVDGLGSKKFTSPFILAIIKALESTKVNLNPPAGRKKILALVSSDIFGKKLCSCLKKKGWTANYIIGQSSKVKQADVLICACGRPNLIKSSMIKKDCILIDGGISKRGKEIRGDIDIKSVAKKASFLSPVPGGIGPITIAMLFNNVIMASKS